MIRRKKYLIIFNVIFLMVYLISTAFFFSSEHGSTYSDYNDHQLNIGDFEYLCQSNYFESTDEIVYSVYDYLGSYPTIVAIYDDKGELINKSGSFVEFTDENWNKQYINLEEYLTDDIRTQLHNLGISTQLYTKLRYTEKNNVFIPVSLLLYDKVIQFTEYKEYTTTLLEAKITFVDVGTVWYKHRAYETIKNKLDDLKEPIKKHIEDVDYVIETGSFGKDNTTSITCFNLNGNKYTLAIVSCTDLFFETLNSNNFRDMLFSFSIIVFIIYVVLFIILSKTISKTEKNEHIKTAFTSAAAHELKTPLSVIENQCECIMESVAPEKNAEYINSIYAETLRINRLVASLLQYNRLASADNIKMEKCKLDEMVNIEIEKYQTYFSTKNIKLETDICDHSEIKCNAELIALVIDNYLSNAVKHTENGNTIRISLTKHNNSYKLSVYNEGKNIPSEYKDMLFNVLYKTDKSRNRDDNSTGMGLAICKEILEQHKFKYGCINKRNGVEFYFTT